MSKKFNLTGHALKRLYQRVGLTEKSGAKGYVKNALKNGKHIGDFPESPFKDFLRKKADATGKRVRVYKGFVFIFNTSNNGLTTLYEIPEEFKDFV